MDIGPDSAKREKNNTIEYGKTTNSRLSLKSAISM